MIGSLNNGGSERQAVQLARSLAESQEIEVRIGTMNRTGVLLEPATRIDSELPEFAISSFFSTGFLMQARRCAKFINDNKIDLIHSHDFYTNVFGMAVSSIARNCTFVASKRETGGMRTAMQDRIESLAFRRADAIVVNSNAVQSYLNERGIPSDKIRLINNGLETERFAKSYLRLNVVTRLGLPDRPEIKFVTIVANLRHDVKNIPMLLRAAAQLTDTGLHFIIAGEGELRPSLEALAGDLGIAERVHFIGRCDNVAELLAISFAGVLTSKAEGCSNSLLEYMAAGLPVVATNVGGAAEVVMDGVNGYLIASDDDVALAVRLSTIAKDADIAAEFGRQGKAMVSDRFSIDSQVRKTRELYNEVLGR